MIFLVLSKLKYCESVTEFKFPPENALSGLRKLCFLSVLVIDVNWFLC